MLRRGGCAGSSEPPHRAAPVALRHEHDLAELAGGREPLMGGRDIAQCEAPEHGHVDSAVAGGGRTVLATVAVGDAFSAERPLASRPALWTGATSPLTRSGRSTGRSHRRSRARKHWFLEIAGSLLDSLLFSLQAYRCFASPTSRDEITSRQFVGDGARCSTSSGGIAREVRHQKHRAMMTHRSKADPGLLARRHTQWRWAWPSSETDRRADLIGLPQARFTH